MQNEKKIPFNLNFIGPDKAGLATISNLTVGFMCNNAEELSPTSVKSSKDIAKGVAYRGCDFLFTYDWPSEMHHFINDNELELLKSSGVGLGVGSKSVESFTTALRPRYHIAVGRNMFFQRSPYKNISGSQGQQSPVTRFIGLSKVSNSKEKNKKWLHALSIDPIIYMSNNDVADEPIGTTDRPYVEIGKSKDNYNNNNNKDSHLVKRFKADDNSSTASGAFFFGSKGTTRDGKNMAAASLNLNATSETAKVLFIGGLSRDTFDDELKDSLPGILSVRRPEGKSFAFVEFESHSAAKAVIEASTHNIVVLNDRNLNIGWAKEKNDSRTSSGIDLNKTNSSGLSTGSIAFPPLPPGNAPNMYNNKYESLKNPPSCDATTLFIGGLISSSIITIDSLKVLFPNSINIRLIPNKPYAFVDFKSNEFAQEVINNHSSDNNSILFEGQPVTIGWAKSSFSDSDNLDENGNRKKRERTKAELSPPYPDSKTLFVGSMPESATEDDIEQLFTDYGNVSVRRPEGKQFAFVEFQSPRNAAIAINNGAANGSQLLLKGQELWLGWAKGRPADKHNPFSHDADCWFCLASKAIKIHLISSVGEYSYIALPRGGINEMHTLISPIECVNSRIHLSEISKKELIKYELAVENMFKENGFASLRFERAIRTQGRDHMQEHLIPIPIDKVNNALNIFMDKSNEKQLNFMEIMV
jgi:RNA recognition motif-containing protein